MTVTAKMYGSFLKKALNKEIDWDSDDIRVALVTSLYTPDQDTDSYWSDVVAREAAGTGYTANGQALANATSTFTASTNVLKLTGDAIQWPGSTVSAKYAVIYDRTPSTDATRPLLGYVDMGVTVGSANGTFQITWDTAGIFVFTVA